ncbi:hypothetical protein GFY24_22455 [Nocardia sp. SYP-A9097]|uniref:hypothetical protein n=1 Tax=Nocardia sp. SYP-A9097 TaxID=2663237 RepID=UPI00129A6D93|nr:hypothetical protein [Nocardia sp. SYP-A9097]MRH90168.1 hypothetical protein [Nocardia sp. SYP-A9097]
MSQYSVTGESGEVYEIALGDIGIGGGLRRCRDRDGRERIYKEYQTPVDEPDLLGFAEQALLLGREIVLAAEAEPESREWAAASINWPIDLIMRDRALTGVILPLIPAEFLDTDGTALTLEQLVGEHPAEAYFRVGVLIRVCDVFLVLEERYLALPGIDERNLAWSRAQPRAHLIDCDGLRPALGADEYSGRLALANLIRCGLFLAPGIPEDLDIGLRLLFERADTAAPEHKPSAQHWLSGLKAAFLTADAAAYRTDMLKIIDRPAPPPLRTGAFPQPPKHSGGRVAGILLAVAGLIAVIALIALRAGDPGTTEAVTPTPTTPAFDPAILDVAGTDTTPFTADALLPPSFRDARNVEYTRRAGGVKDCITQGMSQNVKQILTSYHCTHQVAGSYLDQSNQILVSLNVIALPTTAEATTLYNTMKGRTQDWTIWCPTSGPGTTLCDNDAGSATRTAWGSTSHRYIYKSTALYLNLTTDPTAKQWLAPAAEAAVKAAGPTNYWHQ